MLNVILLLYYLTQRLQVSGKPLLLVSYVCLFLTVFVTMVGCYQLSSVCPSVHLFVCLSRSGIVSKWINISSYLLYYFVAQSF